MFTTILSILNVNKKIFIYITVVLAFILSFFLIYNKGLNNGIEQERNRLSVEYSKILEERIKDNSDRLTREFSEKLKIEQNNIKKEYIYIETKKEVNDIIKKSKNLNKEEDLLSDEEVIDFNRLTRRVK